MKQKPNIIIRLLALFAILGGISIPVDVNATDITTDTVTKATRVYGQKDILFNSSGSLYWPNNYYCESGRNKGGRDGHDGFTGLQGWTFADDMIVFGASNAWCGAKTEEEKNTKGQKYGIIKVAKYNKGGKNGVVTYDVIEGLGHVNDMTYNPKTKKEIIQPDPEGGQYYAERFTELFLILYEYNIHLSSEYLKGFE